MSSDGRQWNPVRHDKREFRQEHVRGALRRALRQGKGSGWTVGSPTAPTRAVATLGAPRGGKGSS